MKIDRRQFLRSSAVVAASAGLFGKESLANANDTLMLVDNGVAKATVVIDSDADAQTRHAADEVIRYVEEATGAALPLATLDPANPAVGNRILVGVLTTGSGVTQQEVDALGQDGYIIRRAANNLTIIGGDGWGNRYGVYEFCERYLDVRWLMPDELIPGQVGRDVPNRTDLTVSSADITENPAYIERMLHPLPPALTPEFMDWDWEADNAPWLTVQGRSWGDYARLRHAMAYVHNLYRVISPSKYGDPNKPETYHPEFFPIHNGQHDIPAPNRRTGWQPRFSAPGIAAAAADEVLTNLRENPQVRSYSLAVNDGYGYSEDDIDPDGVTNVLGYRTYSEAYYAFVNDVAALVSEEFPDALITVLAYRRVGRPPSFDLHPNVFPLITRDTYLWVRDDVRDRDTPWVDRWAQVSQRFGLWDYVWGAPYCIPRMYLGELGRTFSDLHAKGCVAAMAQADVPWGEGPKPWVLSKLYQDPDQSVPRLTYEWCSRVAGRRAAPHLWAYFRLWERLWTERIPQSEWFNLSKRAVYADRRDAGYLEVVTEADVDDARCHLQRAADLATTEAQANRVKVLATWFAYYEASALSYPKRCPVPDRADNALTTIDDAVAVLDRNIGLAHDRLQMGELFHQGQPRGNDHPQRYGLVWSGWDLYAAWAVAVYILVHEPEPPRI